MIRRAVPFAVLPLAVIACGLASAPWLRAFPSSTMSVPLFGAALLSVLTPVVVTGIGLRRLWLTALVDVLMWIFYTLLVGLHELGGFADLYGGLVHGPAQILSYALPLVSPRTLLVAPITLCWVGGAVLGECIGRSWHSVVPYATLLVTFGLAYAGSARGITSLSSGRHTDVLLGAALLLTLLLMRAGQAWIEQDLDSEASQPDGVLPLRGLAVGGVVSLVVALAAAGVTAAAFRGPPTQPARTPPLNSSTPLSPVAFVAGLRPARPGAAGSPVFRVSVDRRTSKYIAIADTDFYDGDGWSFDRTFRPSGGTVPAESDPTLRAPGPAVEQVYTVDGTALTGTPWLPFLYRPVQVTGASVDVDTSSGMIVPSGHLYVGTRYDVRSTATPTSFDTLKGTPVIATSTPPDYLSVPSEVSRSLGTVVTSLENETRTPSTDRVAFLQALTRDLRSNYALSGGSGRPGTGVTAAAPSTSASASPSRSPSTSPSASPSASPSTSRPASAPHPAGRPSPDRPTSAHRFAALAPTRTRPIPAPPTTTRRGAASSPTPTPTTRPSSGGTGFANVLAAILGPDRSATPEQYATLVALVARQIGVPARLVTGFRVRTDGNRPTMAAGTYAVTTADAWTWVEIPVQGSGWVVLDPSPGTYGAQHTPPSQSARPTSSPTPTLTPNGLVTQSTRSGHAVAPKSHVPRRHGLGGGELTLVVVLCVVAALLLLVLALVLRKVLRARRRRRPGDPRARLIGAWRESLDVLQESGLPDLSTLTSAEVAARTGERFGGETGAQARWIGDRANVAIFSPTSWISNDEADAVWRAHVVLRRSVRRGLTLPARVRWELSYHRARRPRRAPVTGARRRLDAGAGRRGGGRRRAH